MKTNTIRFIIIFSALALTGLIITQTFWVTKAFQISRKNYEHRVHSALGATIDEMAKTKLSVTLKLNPDTTVKNVLQIINPVILDSLLHKYIVFYQLDPVYQFSIVRSRDDSIIFRSKENKIENFKGTIFKHCLSKLYEKEHFHIELIFPELQKSLLLKVWGWLLISVVFLVIIIFCFGFIIFAVYKQKKISEMKTDFINNMTHEFKTPISTISLASEILVNSNNENNPEKFQRYAKIIYEENQRMRSQVEQVLRMAQLDKGEYEINKEETDVHELIQNAVCNMFIEDSEMPVKLDYKFNAANPVIMADPLHLSNVIKNLVENAYKYSSNVPEIEILSENNPMGIVISVKDNGIGISPDEQKYIFDKFYRVPTGDIHDVKGFGIGLYYVKVIIEAHSGQISVKSETGQGSRFDVFLPFK